MENFTIDQRLGPSRQRFRGRLIMSSAIAAVLGTPAYAQVVPPVTPPPVTPPVVLPPVVPPAPANNSLPTRDDVVRNPNDARVQRNGSNLNVDLRAQRTVIDWARFDVPEGQAANFRDDTGGSSTRSIAVLNRVVGRTGTPIDPSDILGDINSDRNVSVFLLNPTGILFGANSAINTGSFTASTLALSDADFLANRLNFTQSPLAELSGAAGSPPRIEIRAGAEMNAQSGPLVLVSEQIDTAGTLTSVDDIVMVAASDVSMDLTPGSPVSIRINSGSRIRGPLRVRGQVTGQNVYLATATRGGINDALLDVGGVVTANSAVETDRGIVLVAGGGDGSFGGVSVANGASGRVDLRVAANLTATGPLGYIGMRASGGLATTGTLTAADAVTVLAPGAVGVGGNVGADVIVVDGGSIVLGTEGASRTLTARRQASYTTRAGALVATGDLRLNAGNGTRGVGDLVLDATGGNIALFASGIVAGGTVGVRLGTPGTALQLASVTADRLTGVGAGGTPFLDFLRVDGDVDVGDLTLARTLDLSSTGRVGTGVVNVTAGDLRLDGATGTISNQANASGNVAVGSRFGSIRVGGLRAGGNALLDGGGQVDVAFVGGADVRATAAGALNLGQVEARGTLRATGQQVAGNLFTAGTTLEIESRAGDVSLGNGVAGGSARVDASGDARIGSLQSLRGDIDLDADGALSGSGSGAAVLRADAGSIRVNVGQDARVSLASAGQDVTIAARTLDLGRAVAARGSVSATTSDDLRLTTATAGRDVRLTAGGTLAVAGDVSAGGLLAFQGEGVSLGGTAPARQAAAGSVTVRATDGDIVGAAGLTLAADTDATGNEPLILDAARGTIRMGGTTASGGGSAVAVRVAAGQPLVLGTVSGTNLLSLGDAGALGPLFTSGPITLGTVTVRDDLRVETSSGNIVADAIGVTAGGASLTASGANGSISLGSLAASGAVALTATDIGFASVSGSSVALDASRTLRGTTVNADGAIRATGTGVALGDVTSRTAGLDARAGTGGLGIGTVTVFGNAALTTTGTGAIETRSLTAGSARIDSAAALRVGTARTTGDLQAIAATTIGGIDGGRAGLTAGGTLSVRAGEAALLGAVGGASVAIRAAGLDVEAVDATGEASLASDTALTLGRATAGGTLRVAATDQVALPGALNAGGDLLVSGGSVVLGGANPVLQSANGRVEITATAGGITGRSGLTLRANADGVGTEPLVLDATGGDILFADGTTLQGGPARQSVVAVRIGTPGRSVTLDRVEAARFTGVDAARTDFSAPIDGPVRIATLGLRGPLELIVRGALSLGNVDVIEGGINLQSTGDGAGIDARNLSASGSVVAATSGAFTASSVESRDAGVSITGASVTLPVATARTTLAINATRGNAALGTTTSGGDTAVSATGDATFASMTSAGSIDTRAGGAIAGDRVAATGPATVNAGGAVRLGEIAGSAIGVTGGTTTIGRARTAGALALTSTGDLALGDGEAASATLRATGAAAVTGTLATTGDLGITTGGDLAAGTLRSGGAATLAAGRDVTGGSLTATGAASVSAVGVVRMTAIDGRTVMVDGGTIALDRARTAEALALTSRGDVSLGNAEAGSAALRAAGSAAIGGTLTTTGDLGIVAGQDVAAGTLRSGGAAILTAGRDVTGGSLTAIGAANVSAVGAVRMTSIEGRAVSVDGGTITLDRARAADMLALTSRGDLSLGDGEAGSANVRAAGTATIGGTLTTTGDLGIVAGQDLAAGTLRSGGTATLTAGRDVTGGSLTVIGAANVSATGAVRLTRIDGSTVAVEGATVALDGARTAGALSLTSRGDVTLGNGEAASATLRAAGSAVVTGTLATTGDLAVVAGQDVAAGTLRSGGAATLAAGRDVTGGALNAVGAASVTATGAVRMTGIEARAVAVDGGTIALDRARSGSTLALTSRGDLTLGDGEATGAATLRSGGDATVAQRLAASEIALTATGDVASANLASRGGIALAGRSVRGGSATAATSATIDASGAVQFDRLATGGGTTVRAGAIAIGGVDVAENLTLTSGGALTLGGGRVTGTATLDGVGTATLGGLQAAAIALRAADAEINGTLSAPGIRVANRDASAAGRMTIGDGGAGTDGFRLSNAEFGRLATDALVVDAGAGRAAIGALDVGTDAGRRTFDLLATGTIDVGGAFSAGGSGRSIRIGGGSDAGTMASSIRVVATPDGGGRLLVGDNALELRAARIGVGQAPGFLDRLDAAIAAGTSPRDAAAALVGNSSSALYNAAFGGRPFAAGTVLISARNLSLNFTDYALVQNTALSGQTSGIVLGGPSEAPVLRALTANGAFGGVTGPGGTGAGNSLALFGTINGVGSNATAVLGRDVIDISGVDRANSRLNGCAVASVGGGCLTNVLVQPVLALFDVEGTRLFAIADTLVVPFESSVGSSNEALLTISGGPLDVPDDTPPTPPTEGTR